MLEWFCRKKPTGLSLHFMIAVASHSIVWCPHFRSVVSASKWCNLYHTENLSIWEGSFPASTLQEVSLEESWNVCQVFLFHYILHSKHLAMHWEVAAMWLCSMEFDQQLGRRVLLCESGSFANKRIHTCWFNWKGIYKTIKRLVASWESQKVRLGGNVSGTIPKSCWESTWD